LLVGRSIERRVCGNAKSSHLVLGQIPRDSSAGDGKRGSRKVMGAGVLLGSIKDSQPCASRGRSLANGHVASKGG